eukprot:2748311-Pleurochrysis_carterae.AAC.1
MPPNGAATTRHSMSSRPVRTVPVSKSTARIAGALVLPNASASALYRRCSTHTSPRSHSHNGRSRSAPTRYSCAVCTYRMQKIGIPRAASSIWSSSTSHQPSSCAISSKSPGRAVQTKPHPWGGGGRSCSRLTHSIARPPLPPASVAAPASGDSGSEKASNSTFARPAAFPTPGSSSSTSALYHAPSKPSSVIPTSTSMPTVNSLYSGPRVSMAASAALRLEHATRSNSARSSSSSALACVRASRRSV